MPRGIYQRKPTQKVDRVVITCTVCGTIRKMLPCAARQRTGQYCSKKCEGIARIKSESRTTVTCAQCSTSFTKRRDHVRQNNFCSRPCLAESRKVIGARWKDQVKIAEYMKDYNARNVEQTRASKKAWKVKNRPKVLATQRARRAVDGYISPLEWEQIKSEYGNNCVACLQTGPVELDHVIPVSRGGLNVRENAQPLCRSCNSSKGARAIDFRPVYRLKKKLVAAIYGIEVREV